MPMNSPARSIWCGRRTALVVAHPGHELLLHGWMEEARPLVFVLTSGPDSCIDTTSEVITRAGARPGGIFGRFSDDAFHQALLLREKDCFHSLTQELADAFLNDSIDIVVADSAEGFDPAHDLCRVLVDAACALASRVRTPLRNFEFPLIGRRMSRATAIRQRLEDDAWDRKKVSIAAYNTPATEIESLRTRMGDDALREESLRLATPWSLRKRRDVWYTQPRDGVIPAVRFSEHVLPLAGSVQRFVGGTLGRAA